MANLISGIDWFDHGLIPRREPAEEKDEGESLDKDGQDEECRDSDREQG